MHGGTALSPQGLAQLAVASPMSGAVSSRRYSLTLHANSRLACAVVAGAECGPSLDGPTSCFTGALERFPRRGAAQHVVDVGGAFSANLTTQVDPLVGGRRDLDKLNGAQISSEMRKASVIAATGIRVEIISEADVYGMLTA